MNVSTAQRILQSLSDRGVRTLCLCPGARNAPFIECLSHPSPFEVITFYDERSAGFFALGRAQGDQCPVAVLTTSGTAVSELLSAVIEAHYTATPLIVVSSDRPKRLRGTGAPQAIEQSQIFNNYVAKSWDIEAGEEVALPQFLQGPYHLNVCFDEPLIDSTATSISSLDRGADIVSDSSSSSSSSSSSGSGSGSGFRAEKSFNNKKNSKGQFFDLKSSPPKDFPVLRGEKTLVIVSALTPHESKAVAKAIQGLKIPVFAELSSGLRGRPELRNALVKGGEKLVSQLIKSGEVEQVIRIGDVPLGRFWRDLDQLKIPIVNLSTKPWPGLGQSTHYQLDLTQLNAEHFMLSPWDWSQWQQKAEGIEKTLITFYQKYPQSEVSLFKKLADHLSEQAWLYVGNSLPIRIWDLVDDKSRFIHSNRGANGIDGQLSSALGAMKKGQQHWVILGDLTTLYDFNGLWLSSYLRKNQIDVNFVVINNGGGQIFSRIFSNPLFQNRHDLNFKPMADMFSWNYHVFKDPSFELPSSGLNFIEVQPNPEQSQQIWQEYDQLWKS